MSIVLDIIKSKIISYRLSRVTEKDLLNAYDSIKCTFYKGKESFDKIIPYDDINTVADFEYVWIRIAPLQFPPYNVFKYVHDNYLKNKSAIISICSLKDAISPSDYFKKKYKIKPLELETIWKKIVSNSIIYSQLNKQRKIYLKNIYNKEWMGMQKGLF